MNRENRFSQGGNKLLKVKLRSFRVKFKQSWFREAVVAAVGFCVYYSFPRAFSTDDNLVYNRIEKFSSSNNNVLF